jgi:hypothetical protein
VAPDTTPPSVTCSARPASLKSNNHKLASITTTVNVTDAGSGAAGYTLVSVQSNQPDSGLGPGDLPNDIQGWTTGTADTSGLLRTERYGAIVSTPSPTKEATRSATRPPARQQ